VFINQPARVRRVSQGLGFELTPSSGKAGNAASMAHLSHTTRASIRFGPGMRPSATIWSNFVGETPT